MTNSEVEATKTRYYVITPKELEEQQMMDSYRVPRLRESYRSVDRSYVMRFLEDDDKSTVTKKVVQHCPQYSSPYRRQSKTTDEVNEQINSLQSRIAECQAKYDHHNAGGNCRRLSSSYQTDSRNQLDTDSQGKEACRSTCHSVDANVDNCEGKRVDKTKSYQCPVFRYLNANPTKDSHVEWEDDAFLELLSESPESCSSYYQFDYAFPNDWLPPLHMACCLGLSYPVIKMIYKYNPHAIHYVSDQSGMNVLHYATMYTRASIKVLNYLIKQYKKSNSRSRDEGEKGSNNNHSIKAWTESIDNEHHRTPLHMACSCSTRFSFFNPEVILWLTEVNDRCATIVDKYGNTPLHLACQVDQPSFTIIDDLTTVYLDACTVEDKTKTKSIPLHHMLCHPQVENPSNEFVDAVRDLVNSCPSSLKMTRQKGGYVLNYIPIFIAIDRKADIQILKILIKYWPRCLLETDTGRKHGMNPFQYAKETKGISDPDILDLLKPQEEES